MILLAVAISLAVMRQFRTSAVHFVQSSTAEGETSQTSGDNSDISSDDTKTPAAASREGQAIVPTSAEKADGVRSLKKAYVKN